MVQKSVRMAIRDKKVKRLLKKGERAATIKDFTELLKRSVQEKTV